MFSAPLGRGRSVRDYVQGYVRPACELWMSRAATLLMFSPPSSRGWGARDCVWGDWRPMCRADVYPRYVFGTPGTMPGHSRLCVGLCEPCVRGDRWCVWRPCLCFRHPWEKPECSKLCAGLYRGIGGACGDPAYVFAAFFTRLGCSRVCAGLYEACVRGWCLPSLCFRHPWDEVGVFEIMCRVM